MKVKELIGALEQFDPESDVGFIHRSTNGFVPMRELPYEVYFADFGFAQELAGDTVEESIELVGDDVKIVKNAILQGRGD